VVAIISRSAIVTMMASARPILIKISPGPRIF
jgi:hypothetical protein